MRFDLVAVGEVLLDLTLPALVPGEVRHSPVRLRVGGTAVNAALAAAADGARAAVVGRVGSDAAGEAIRSHLAAAGVEPLLATDSSAATGVFVEATVDGMRTVAVDRGASAVLDVDDLPAVAATGVLVSGYLLFDDGTREAAGAALGSFGASVVGVTAGSASVVAGLGLREVHRRTKGANVLVANADEAHALTGLPAQEAAVELAGLFGTACVTLGADGAVAASEGRVERVAAEAVAGADALGAGDALAGVLVASLACGRDLADALRAGVAAGARAAE
jgi:sugar/nucleoside kinase (ribokinase family)